MGAERRDDIVARVVDFPFLPQPPGINQCVKGLECFGR